MTVTRTREGPVFSTHLLDLDLCASECESSSGKANVSDVRMLNLDFIADVVVKKEAGSSPVPPPQPLNIDKVET